MLILSWLDHQVIDLSMEMSINYSLPANASGNITCHWRSYFLTSPIVVKWTKPPYWPWSQVYVIPRILRVRVLSHEDVIKWKHFPLHWPFMTGIHRSPMNSPHKGQWRGTLMFSLICAWINGWGNNSETSDLRRPLWRHCNDGLYQSITTLSHKV